MFGVFITILAIIFWVFRIAVTLMYSAEINFLVVPMNMTFEIVLLFLTFIWILLIARKKMVGAIFYLITQCAYFGVDAYKNLELIMNGTNVDTNVYLNLGISILAVIIPFLAIMCIGLDNGKGRKKQTKQTDWFYGNSDYDRKFDDRADRNQYKF